MAFQKSYTQEFRDQAVRFVFESIEPDETRSGACRRLAPKMSVSFSTLYGWVKKATPISTGWSVVAGSQEDLVAQVAALKKEVREISRANDILKAASTFFGAELDRQSRK
jgi:transposase